MSSIISLVDVVRHSEAKDQGERVLLVFHSSKLHLDDDFAAGGMNRHVVTPFHHHLDFPHHARSHRHKLETNELVRRVGESSARHGHDGKQVDVRIPMACFSQTLE